AGTCGCGVTGLLAGNCVPGVTAAEGVVGAEGFAAGVCGGDVLRLARPSGAGVDVAGAIAAEGVVGVAAGVCAGDVAGLALPAGAGDGVAGVIAADGDDGVAGLAAGPCDGAVAGLALPGAGVDVPGVIAAGGVVGVAGVVVGDGRGCPFIPGNGWPGRGAVCVAVDPGTLGCAPPCGAWV